MVDIESKAISDKRAEFTPVHTPTHNSGFGDRLHKVLGLIGHAKKRGRYVAVSRMTGRSESGAKLLFSNDRPPKQYEVFGRLVRALVSDLESKAGITLSIAALEDYLLNGRRDPFKEKSNNSNDYGVIDVNDSAHQKRPHLYRLQVCDLVNRVGMELNFNLLRDFDLDQLESIYSRVVKYCISHDIDLEAKEEELKDVITKLIELTNQSVL